jgi:DNA polymerase III delta prime subunit
MKIMSVFERKLNLEELDFKSEIMYKFRNSNVFDLNNLLIHGCATCGKTTQIYAFLCSLFGKKVYNLKNVMYEEDKKIMNYKSSLYHIEINPLILGKYEKLFMTSFLIKYTETQHVANDFPKIIFIKNADKLSKNSQFIIRKIIEKNFMTSKFILETSNLSVIDKQILSRCLFIRIPFPTIIQIKKCLMKCLKNDCNNDSIIDNIIKESNKMDEMINLKKIFGFFYYYINTNTKFTFLYYHKFDEMIKYMQSKKITFTNLQKIRDIIYELYIIHVINVINIINVINVINILCHRSIYFI